MDAFSEWGKIVNTFSLLVSTMEWSFPGADKGSSIKQYLPKLVSIGGFVCVFFEGENCIKHEGENFIKHEGENFIKHEFYRSI